MPYEAVLVEKQEGAGIITLNRPERLNALSRTLTTELDQALSRFEQDQEIKAIIVTGTGNKAFSAGADIHEMVQQSEVQNRTRDARSIDWLWHHYVFGKRVGG